MQHKALIVTLNFGNFKLTKLSVHAQVAWTTYYL